MRSIAQCQTLFSYAVLDLVLAAIVAVFSASASADSVSSSANTTVFAPVNVGDTILVYFQGALVSDGIVNLTIRLPQGAAGITQLEQSTPSFSTSVIPLEILSEDCLLNNSSVAACVELTDEDGMLNGVPVSNITLNIVDDDRGDGHDIGVTVGYN